MKRHSPVGSGGDGLDVRRSGRPVDEKEEGGGNGWDLYIREGKRLGCLESTAIPQRTM